jgi:hypothetical protein
MHSFPPANAHDATVNESVGAIPGRGNNTSSTNNPVVMTSTATTTTNSNNVEQILSDVDTTIKLIYHKGKCGMLEKLSQTYKDKN